MDALERKNEFKNKSESKEIELKHNLKTIIFFHLLFLFNLN